jgi:glycosyltransferase involved in cell wall biosynthesis
LTKAKYEEILYKGRLPWNASSLAALETSVRDGTPMIQIDSDHVDVVVLTKNSERVLEKSFNSIFKNVPVNRLIVVDGYSNDSTLEIVRKFNDKYGNVVLIKDGGTRGSARSKGIREVQTEWFLFVDSDVTLCDNWYSKAKKFVGDDVGAVWGTEVWAGLRNSTVLKLFLMVTRRIFEMRGGTHDLLVRYEAVKDIDIPRDLHVFEDALIKEWIARKGYKVVPTYDPFCIHYRPQSVWTFKGSRDLVLETLRYGSLKKMPRYLLVYPFYTAYVLYRSAVQRLRE